jgi:AcrR family transcriptional regulator
LGCQDIGVSTRKRNKAKKPEARPTYHHGNLRAALIQGGLELIEEKGIRALTLREIGDRLGVSRSAPYRHFNDKTDLLSAISQAGFIVFGNVIAKAKNSAGSGFAAQMDAILIAYVHFANEHRAQFEVMYAALLEGGGTAEGSGLAFTILRETIREAQELGEVRPDDPARLTHVVWDLVHGASMLRRHEDDAEIRFKAEVLRSGLSNRQTTTVSPQAADVRV